MLDTLPVSSSQPTRAHYDVIIVGSGMGGGTLAYALKDANLSVLVVERGDFLPQEPENWDAQAVFVDGRYKNAEKWYDAGNGAAFSPGTYYYVGGNTKLYGASLVRFRREDFQHADLAEGPSPAWPVGYEDFEPHYAAAERLYRVHGELDDPTLARQCPLSVRRRRARAADRTHCRRSAQPRVDAVAPVPWRRPPPGRRMHQVRDVRRLPLPRAGQG